MGFGRIPGFTNCVWHHQGLQLQQLLKHLRTKDSHLLGRGATRELQPCPTAEFSAARGTLIPLPPFSCVRAAASAGNSAPPHHSSCGLQRSSLSGQEDVFGCVLRVAFHSEMLYFGKSVLRKQDSTVRSGGQWQWLLVGSWGLVVALSVKVAFRVPGQIQRLS